MCKNTVLLCVCLDQQHLGEIRLNGQSRGSVDNRLYMDSSQVSIRTATLAAVIVAHGCTPSSGWIVWKQPTKMADMGIEPDSRDQESKTLDHSAVVTTYSSI